MTVSPTPQQDDVKSMVYYGEDALVPSENEAGDLYERARVFATRDKPSTSYLQRRLQIGFNQAAGLIERMEAEGLISASNSAGYRTILKPYVPPVATADSERLAMAALTRIIPRLEEIAIGGLPVEAIVTLVKNSLRIAHQALGDAPSPSQAGISAPSAEMESKEARQALKGRV